MINWSYGKYAARLVSVLSIFVLGCSSDSTGTGDPNVGSGSDASPEGAALFETPQGGVTANTIVGVWGGTVKDLSITFDVRYKFAPNSITVGNRCTLDSGSSSPIAGTTSAARVTNTSIVILESKKDTRNNGAVRCGVSLVPMERSVCNASESAAFRQNCFTLEGTSLVLYGDSLSDKVELVKISD